MEENITYDSLEINLLDLVFNIITKYDSNKDNLICLSFGDDDLTYCHNYYLDQNNNFTINLYTVNQNFYEEQKKITNNPFDIEKYVIGKINIIKKFFEIIGIDILPVNKVINDLKYGDETGEIIPNYNVTYKIKIIKESNEVIKAKLLNYINKEISNKNFEYNIEIIEEEIIKQFEEKGKNLVTINYNYPNLVKKLKKINTSELLDFNTFKKNKNSSDDIIIIKSYNNDLELFLYKLILDGKINTIKLSGSNYYIERKLLYVTSNKDINKSRIEKNNTNSGINEKNEKIIIKKYVISKGSIKIILTKIENTIIKEIKNNNTKGGINLDNLIKITQQTIGAFNQSLKCLRKKIKNNGINEEIIIFNKSEKVYVLNI